MGGQEALPLEAGPEEPDKDVVEPPPPGVLQPIKDRPMSAAEIERMRLALSTFRDGSGQFLKKIDGFMPDYLDFERVTALVCGGTTAENKGIFDVSVPTPNGLPFGVSCKMASTQKGESKSAFMEMSNSKKKFDDQFASLGIEWRTEPEKAGPAIVDLVMSWHHGLAAEIDLASSRYLVLSHDTKWDEFQLLCFPLSLAIADPYDDVEWCNEGDDKNGGPSTVAGYIYDGDRKHRLWQLYQNSGGQLKYYPLLEWAEWTSPPFGLEEPPVIDTKDKVEQYFPGKWPD